MELKTVTPTGKNIIEGGNVTDLFRFSFTSELLIKMALFLLLYG